MLDYCDWDAELIISPTCTRDGHKPLAGQSRATGCMVPENVAVGPDGVISPGAIF